MMPSLCGSVVTETGCGRLVDPTGDGFEVCDVQGIGVEGAVPPHDVERVVCVHEAREPGAGAHHHLDVLALDAEWLSRSPEVALAERRVLEELTPLGQVARRRPYVPGRLHREETHRLARAGDDAVRGGRRDHHVVAETHRECAEHRLDDSLSGLHVQQLVPHPVAVQRRRLPGHGVGEPNVTIAEHQPTPPHGIVGRADLDLVCAHVSRCQWVVGAELLARRLTPRLDRDHGGGQSLVVQKRRLAREPFLSHQLLGVQAAVRLAELGVALARDLSYDAIVRHGRLSSPLVDSGPLGALSTFRYRREGVKTGRAHRVPHR